MLTGSTENPRRCRLTGSGQNICLTVTLGTEMLMGFLDIWAVECPCKVIVHPKPII